jgi:large subunit ribosomal protein L15
LRYEPDYFGKSGFTSPKSLKQRGEEINVGFLDEFAEKLSTKKEDQKLFIDLESLGYAKLLGSGKVTKPMVVRIASCSKSAAEKIKEAGGQVLTESEEQGA